MLPTNQCTFKITEKNTQFDYKYNLSHAQKIEIIRSITVADFVESRPNAVPTYPDAELFIFHKAVELVIYGEKEKKLLYIKEYIIDDKNMEMVIVISFHEEGLHDL